MANFIRSKAHRDLCLEVTDDLIAELKTAYLLGLKQKYVNKPVRKYPHIINCWGSAASVRGDWQVGKFKFCALKVGETTWSITMWGV